MSIKPVMSMYATELDCLRARDKWYFERNATIERENAKQAERIKALEAHIQEAADLMQGHRGITHRTNELRDFHLAALEPKEPTK